MKLILALMVVALVGCDKLEGPVGPQGEQGEQGQ